MDPESWANMGTCLHCEEPVLETEQRRPIVYGQLAQTGEVEYTTRWVHWECFRRQLIGGARHIEGRCRCFAGSCEPDDPGLSRREAALVACAAWNRLFSN